ncbi:wax ester/triacylglycerol synthase domain-containing protein [Agromyces sp. ZXT2-6]|uniref:wax ester/triacylglycerol synthase domain-containing protein n=1 Tax=Agromyces sp. ZXT2-6 TaxID=3461153 RepID=UPI004054A0F9
MGGQRMPRERLSPADASNIEIDARDQVNAFLMAGVLAPGGVVAADGALDLAALRTGFAERLPREPRLSQRVVRRGRVLAWEDVRVDLDRHVRVVEPVDGVAGLESLCARLMVTPMSTDRPLWELLVVPGVAPDRVGIVLRIHHAMADGIAAVRLVETLLDADGAGRAASGTPAGRPPGPRARRGFPARVRSIASGVSRTASMLRRAIPATPLLGRIGPHRGIAFVEAPIGPLASGARSQGGTLNDALLAAVAAGAEAALRERGAVVPPALPASVPVALGDRGRSGNAVGVMLARLPTGEADAATRLRRIAELTRAGKDDARSRGTLELIRTRLGARVFASLARHQRLIAMFVTNVPGPRHPLAIAGAPLERVWPVAAIQGNVRLGVAALSYDGALRIAVHCDADAVPVEVVARTLRSELARIAALA